MYACLLALRSCCFVFVFAKFVQVERYERHLRLHYLQQSNTLLPFFVSPIYDTLRYDSKTVQSIQIHFKSYMPTYSDIAKHILVV